MWRDRKALRHRVTGRRGHSDAVHEAVRDALAQLQRLERGGRLQLQRQLLRTEPFLLGASETERLPWVI